MSNTNYNTTVKVAPAPLNDAPTNTTNLFYDPNSPTNLPTDANKNNNTTRFFNNYFTAKSTVSSNINDAIVSFFQQRTNSLDSAKLLAQAVINTAVEQKMDPMTVLNEFMSLDNTQLNAYLALFLNTSRINTSLLGITNVPQANQYVARTIVV